MIDVYSKSMYKGFFYVQILQKYVQVAK